MDELLAENRRAHEEIAALRGQLARRPVKPEDGFSQPPKRDISEVSEVHPVSFRKRHKPAHP
jgi:hypothetical protein